MFSWFWKVPLFHLETTSSLKTCSYNHHTISFARHDIFYNWASSAASRFAFST